MNITKSVPESEMKDSYASKIIEVIGSFLHLESVYKGQKLTPGQIHKTRNKAHPVIHKVLEALVFNTPYKPNSAIEGAIIKLKRYGRNYSLIWILVT